MGLELTEDVIRENMPEYLPGAANSVNQVRSETLAFLPSSPHLPKIVRLI